MNTIADCRLKESEEIQTGEIILALILSKIGNFHKNYFYSNKDISS